MQKIFKTIGAFTQSTDLIILNLQKNYSSRDAVPLNLNWSHFQCLSSDPADLVEKLEVAAGQVRSLTRFRINSAGFVATDMQLLVGKPMENEEETKTNIVTEQLDRKQLDPVQRRQLLWFSFFKGLGQYFPRFDSQLGRPVWPRLTELIPQNRFRRSLNVYKYGLSKTNAKNSKCRGKEKTFEKRYIKLLSF